MKIEKKLKKRYENQQAQDMKITAILEREKELEKHEQLKKLQNDMILENQRNKEMQKAEKDRNKLEDIEISKQYIDQLDEQERKKKEEIQRRDNKIRVFMERMEKSVIAEENKKQQLMEESIKACESR